VEDDRLLLGKEKPLITGSEHHTIFIKNSIKFSYFGERFHRNNMPNHVCLYNFTDPNTWLCNIFKLGKMYICFFFCFLNYPIIGEIVAAAGGDYTSLSIGGGVVALQIQWIYNLDFDFIQNCLPK
jgi:hypothetical protein